MVQQWPCGSSCTFHREGPTHCRGRHECGGALVCRTAVSGVVSRVAPQLLQAPSPCGQHCVYLRLQAFPSWSWLPSLLSEPFGRVVCPQCNVIPDLNHCQALTALIGPFNVSVASSSHQRPPGGAGWELTGCGAVAWGAWREGHIGGAAGGVVGEGCEVGAQEGRAQDSSVVRRSWLDSQHTGRAGNLQHRVQT